MKGFPVAYRRGSQPAVPLSRLSHNRPAVLLRFPLERVRPPARYLFSAPAARFYSRAALRLIPGPLGVALFVIPTILRYLPRGIASPAIQGIGPMCQGVAGGFLSSTAGCSVLVPGNRYLNYRISPGLNAPVGYWLNDGAAAPGTGGYLDTYIGGRLGNNGLPNGFRYPRISLSHITLTPAAFPIARPNVSTVPASVPLSQLRNAAPFLGTDLPQGRQVGYIRPRTSLGVGVRYDVRGRHKPRSRTVTQTVNRPPRTNEKEKKFLRNLAKLAAISLSLYSDGREYIRAVYNALPEQSRRGVRAYQTHRQLARIFRDFEYINWGDAFLNLSEEVLEDRLYGAIYSRVRGPYKDVLNQLDMMDPESYYQSHRPLTSEAVDKFLGGEARSAWAIRALEQS